MVQLEAASGIIDAYVFVVKEFHSLGVTRKNFKICAYDFFAYHYLTGFDGALGLDFFGGLKFCIDMQQNEITVSSN